MPYKAGSFESPVVPDFVTPGVFVGVESKIEFFQATLGVEARDGFVAIDCSEGFDKFPEDFLKGFALISRKFANRDTCERPIGSETDIAFAGCLGDFGHLALFAIEHLVDTVCREGLFPENIPWVIGAFVIAAGCVAVEDGAAKGDVFLCVAIAAKSRVSAGEDELEPLGAGCTEDGEALGFAPSSHIVFELFVKAIVPARIDDPFEDGFDEVFLICGIKVAEQGRFGDVPIVCDASSQQSAIFGCVLPIEADRLTLVWSKRLEEGFDEGFWRLQRGRRQPRCGMCERSGSEPRSSQTRCGQPSGGSQEIAAAESCGLGLASVRGRVVRGVQGCTERVSYRTGLGLGQFSKKP